MLQDKHLGLEEGVDSYFDRNEVLDAILKVLYDYAKDRRIVLASFDADICIMYVLKRFILHQFIFWALQTLLKLARSHYISLLYSLCVHDAGLLYIIAYLQL